MALKQVAWLPPMGSAARVDGRPTWQDPTAEKCVGTAFTQTHLRQKYHGDTWAFISWSKQLRMWLEAHLIFEAISTNIVYSAK